MKEEELFDLFLDSDECEHIFDDFQTALKKAFLFGYENGKSEKQP